MKNYTITVNGNVYDVTVEEGAGGAASAPAPKAAPKKAPAAKKVIVEPKKFIIPDPSGLTIELDVFTGPLKGFVMAEVEFPSEDKAASYTAPDWFGKEVTYDPLFHNSNMSRMSEEERTDFLTRFSYKA